MKHIKFITITLLLSFLVFTPLFASGVTETGKDFKSLDLTIATADEMESAWNVSIENYTKQYSALSDAIADAYKDRNIDDYLELKALQKSLVKPFITEDETNTIVERITSTENNEEKKELASFLSSHSRWYSPTLTFKYSYEKNGFHRSYNKSISITPGEKVTVPELNGFGVFMGWSNEENGEVIYKAGDEIEMPYANTTLYAVFSTGITFKDSISDIDIFVEGEEAEIPTLEEKEGYTFIGWFDQRGLKLEGDKATVEKGETVEYTAYWKALEIGDGSVKYYEDGKIPSGTEVVFSFPITNVGNTTITNLKVNVESEDLDIKSTSALKATYFTSENSSTLSFVVKTDKAAGEAVKLTVNASDSQGNSWSKDFILSVQ